MQYENIKNLDLNSSQIVFYLILIAILITLSALISASEVSFFSIKKNDLNKIKNSKDKNLILKIISEPEKLLSTILISNNFVNVFIVIISSILIDKIYFLNSSFKIFFEIIVITSFIVLFGEVIPKIYASNNYIKFSVFISNFINSIKFILTPVNNILYKIRTKMNINDENKMIDEKELNEAIKIIESNTPIEFKKENEILNSIMKNSKNEVKQIMTPRINIKALNKNEDFKNVLNFIIEHKYSRIPVYEENLDKINGILYIKDIINYLNENEDFDWVTLIRKPFFIPENKKITDLLNDFREKKIHLAIVVDEYGLNIGIVTLEDVIEEIVGEISDEFDEENEEKLYSKINETEYLFKGKIPINDFIKAIKIKEVNSNILNTEAETLAGFILENSGKLPKKNEKIFIDNIIFKIIDVDIKKINEIKVSILNDEK